jgi:hypothetical protein
VHITRKSVTRRSRPSVFESRWWTPTSAFPSSS